MLRTTRTQGQERQRNVDQNEEHEKINNENMSMYGELNQAIWYLWYQTKTIKASHPRTPHRRDNLGTYSN